MQPEHYDLAFDVDLAGARFSGDETIHVQLSAPQRRIVLNAVDLRFEQVEIAAAGSTQAARWAFDRPTETVALTVPRPIPAGPADIRIRYRADLNRSLRGFYLSTANERRYAVTQFESTDARRAFPAFDEPAFKATFALSLTIDKGDTAISNGRVVSDTPAADGRRHTLVFDTTPKMSSYLVAMAVGDFTCLSDEADGTPLRICATPGKEHLRGVAMSAAREILPYLNRYYSLPYPFGKLDIVAVPDFAAGAMENTGAIFYREVDLLADPATASVPNLKRIWSVLAHEMAHQWFGDLVTMQWWNDLWLNEGFATWMETRPLAALKPEWNIEVDEVAASQMAMNLDALASTHAVRAPVETPDEIESAFDAITYEKSAAVLRMIEGWVGEDAFRRGVNEYLRQHAYGNATAEDFWAAMTRVSGKPVDAVLATFVNSPGVPLVSVAGDCETGDEVTVTQSRFFLQPPASPSVLRPLWRVPLCAKGDGATATCDVLASRTDTRACAPGPQPLFLNSGAEGYYRTAYDRPTLRALSAGVADLSAPERLALLGDEWALVRAGVHTAADYLTLAAGFTRERAAGVLDELARRLGTIHDHMLTPSTRADFETFVRSLLQPLLSEIGVRAAPGDDSETLASRATLVGALGRYGGDAAVASQATAALEAALRGDTTLEPTAADAMIAVAASNGDATLWNALVAAAREAQSPGERERYLFALTQFTDPDLIAQGLDLSLGDEVRSQDTARFLGRFLRNPAATAQAWAFVKRNWARLEPRITIAGGDSGLVQSLSGFCSAEARRDIRRFFTEHKLPRASRALEQTLETIDGCVALREKGTPAVTQWLDARRERQ
ncbi:MAG: M1 family metallopeptidase [Vicinamibacterales bacterium]